MRLLRLLVPLLWLGLGCRDLSDVQGDAGREDASNPVDDTLLAWWKFDDGTGTIARDSSGNGRHGDVYGASWTAGKIDGALRFAGGTETVTVPKIAPEEVTVACWLMVHSVTPTSIPQWVVKARSGGGTSEISDDEGFGVYLQRYPNDTPALWWNITSKTATDARQTEVVTVGFPADARWHHVAATYDRASGNQALYVDGRSKPGDLHPAGNVIVPLTARNEISIGGNGPARETLDGLLDDVRVYGRALSAGEIDTLYQQPSAG